MEETRSSIEIVKLKSLRVSVSAYLADLETDIIFRREGFFPDTQIHTDTV